MELIQFVPIKHLQLLRRLANININLTGWSSVEHCTNILMIIGSTFQI